MKAVLSSLSEIPEPMRGEYEQRDGKFYLRLDGEVPGFVSAADLSEANQKLAEFRDKNRSMHGELEQFRTRFSGVDPDEHKKLKEKLAEIEKQGVKGGTDVSALIQSAIQENVGPLQKKLDEITAKEQRVTAQLARKELESVLTQEGLRAGIREEAMPDYINRGVAIWKLEEGKPVARNGETPLFSKKKVTEPLTPAEWVSLLSVDAPHLFRPSKGGGASGGNGGGGGDGSGPRPGRRAGLDLDRHPGRVRDPARDHLDHQPYRPGRADHRGVRAQGHGADHRIPGRGRSLGGYRGRDPRDQ